MPWAHLVETLSRRRQAVCGPTVKRRITQQCGWLEGPTHARPVSACGGADPLASYNYVDGISRWGVSASGARRARARIPPHFRHRTRQRKRQRPLIRLQQKQFRSCWPFDRPDVSASSRLPAAGCKPVVLAEWTYSERALFLRRSACVSAWLQHRSQVRGECSETLAWAWASSGHVLLVGIRRAASMRAGWPCSSKSSSAARSSNTIAPCGGRGRR
jgi:hypothetical protein